MNNNFFKYPTTPHLKLLGDVVVRDDKVMSETEMNVFLGGEIIIEEKVDGANLGISFDDDGNVRAQNRGGYLNMPYTGQWKKLPEWLFPRTDTLFEKLTNRFILFGEWCFAQHSVEYNRLPDWFLGFDIYDKLTARFLSCPRRDEITSSIGIFMVPRVAQGHFTSSEVIKHLSISQLSNNQAEGLYLRVDCGDWLVKRAKLVRSNFIQSVEKHWSHSPIKPNKVRFD